MYVIVPTTDFVRLMSKLKPMKSLVMTGFTFTIYTIEAIGNKLKLIVSDNAIITASSEIFAEVREPGTLSVNGTDFFLLVSKLPHTNNPHLNSKNLELKSDKVSLTVSTIADYTTMGAHVIQSRTFSLVNPVLSAQGSSTLQSARIKVKLPALYMSNVFGVLGKIVSNYTSSIAGLSGVLLRCKAKKLFFVVSDGYRLIEISYPEDINSSDFDIVLPKTTCMVMQSLIGDGDELELSTDGNQIGFDINNSGLHTNVISSVIRQNFPPYHSVMEAQGSVVKLKTKLLVDNISNIRRAIDEDPYRVKIFFSNKTFSVYNYGVTGPVSFKNEGIPLVVGLSTQQNLIINAVLLDSSLSIVGSDEIQITIPADRKPIVIDNLDDSLRIKIVIALVNED